MMLGSKKTIINKYFQFFWFFYIKQVETPQCYLIEALSEKQKPVKEIQDKEDLTQS